MKSPLLRDVVAKCSSWDAFRRALAKKSEKEKGDLFEHLVRAYLLLDPEYATKLRKVWLLDEVPSALRKKLKLPGNDQGIDLIAETNTGEFWAIQCKYRADTARPIPWREISTFTGLTFGVCRHISFGLICSTTERITHVLKHQDRIGFCALDVWQSLDEEFFVRLRKLLGHKPVKLAPLKPRPHQKKAIADARKYFVGKKQKRGKLISPCGSGKSLTAYWIARDLKAKKILVAVPSLALIRQTLKVWLRESLAHGDKVEWICVCSDESAGRVEQDDVAVLRQDLGVPCLTDAKEIASWLKQKKPGLTVVFTTYQSGEAIAKGARRAKFAFDLGIMDEAHKTVGDGAKLFSHLLHENNLPVKRRIFMTATERRYRGKGDKVLSMDDPAIYGDTFHLLSFKRALDEKPAILSDYRIVTILVSRDEVAELIRKNVFLRPNKDKWTREIEAEMLAALVALRKAMRKYPIRHAVSFHSSIRRAEVFKEHNDVFNQAFVKHGAIETFHVSGQTPTGTRARVVKEFAETKRALITNARCLTEGVDVPDIDCVMFADPRRSAVDIVQALGRALRPAKGKKMGYVIVPILHDERAKSEDIFNSEDFQEILTTLRALAANDDRIIEYFRAVSQGKPHSKRGTVVFDIDEKIAERIDLERFVKDIELRCWSRLAKLSWRTFDDAREYARSLEFRNQKQWRAFCRGEMREKGCLPADIPANPNQTYYSEGWRGMGDWLGTGLIATFLRKYRRFKDARIYAHSLKLSSWKEWRLFCDGKVRGKGRLPSDIPRRPDKVYRRSGWLGAGDWLGTGVPTPSARKWRPFPKARAYARKLGLSRTKDWTDFCRESRRNRGILPQDIPADPRSVYKEKGWIGMGDWLGTGTRASGSQDWRAFKTARAYVRNLGLRNTSEWNIFSCGKLRDRGKRPDDIPSNPAQVYRNKGWKGYGDWLGTRSTSNRSRRFLPFRKARAIVRALKLRSFADWNNFCANYKGSSKLSGVPTNPQRTYAGKGWISWPDWLGTNRKRKGKRKR
jgi:superfamily II DNA or RNA helicase